MNPLSIFDFNKNSDFANWYIVNDGVMGGLSSSNFSLNEQGNGVFAGTVSLENNGGFASLRYSFDKIKTDSYQKLVIRVKGDGKRYQLRLKPNSNDYHSYITHIETSEEWQEIKVSLSDFYPSFRGRTLEMPNFSGEYLEDFGILIANKQAEQFKLEIDWIELR